MQIPTEYGVMQVEKSAEPLDADIVVKQADGYVNIWFEPYSEANDEG
jgi:hypothetical protein